MAETFAREAPPSDHPDAPMDREEYERLLRVVHMLRLTAMSISYRLDQAIALAHHADGVGPIFDPTLWLDRSEKLGEDIKTMTIVRDLGRLGEDT